MSLTADQVGALFGGSYVNSPPNVYDLVTGGSSQDLTSALLGGMVEQPASNLTETQEYALSSLTDFVNENVTGPEAESLLSDIEGLRLLMETGNTESALTTLDPVFSLLAGSPELAANLPPGFLVDQLL